MPISFYKKFVGMRMIVAFICISFLLVTGCATTGGVKVRENCIVLGEWEIVGEENGKHLSIHKDKAEYQKDEFAALRVFEITISKLSDMMFSVAHAFGITNVKVISKDLMLANGLAFKRVGVESKKVEYSHLYGEWKGENIVMEIREGEVCFDGGDAWKILEAYEVEGDYIFLAEDDFCKYTFILKNSKDGVWVFGDYSGKVERS